MKHYEKMKQQILAAEPDVKRFLEANDCCARLRLIKRLEMLKKDIQLAETVLWSFPETLEPIAKA